MEDSGPVFLYTLLLLHKLHQKLACPQICHFSPKGGGLVIHLNYCE